MAGVQFDIALKNTGSNVEGLALFSPVQSASQKTNKYAFYAPYANTYPANTVFTLVDDSDSNEITLSAVSTMAEVIALLNELNAGTFILAYNDAINGNVFHLLSTRNPLSLSIDNFYAGAFAYQATIAPSNFNAISQDICWINATTILIGGTNGVIYLSTDAGDSFNPISLPGPGLTVCQFSFIDELNGFVIATDNATHSVIYNTIDGGLNWTIVADHIGYRFSGIKMFDANNGFVFGDNIVGDSGIYSTADGGITLSPVQLFSMTSFKGKIQFVDANVGFVFVYGDVLVLRTTDGGTTWLSSAVPSSYSGYALNVNEVYITGENGAILHSADGGVSFTNIGIVTSNEMFSIHAFSVRHIIVGRQGRQYLETIDGGATWSLHSFGAGGACFLLSFYDEFTGIATDGFDYIYKYS